MWSTNPVDGCPYPVNIPPDSVSEQLLPSSFISHHNGSRCRRSPRILGKHKIHLLRHGRYMPCHHAALQPCIMAFIQPSSHQTVTSKYHKRRTRTIYQSECLTAGDRQVTVAGRETQPPELLGVLGTLGCGVGGVRGADSYCRRCE